MAYWAQASDKTQVLKWCRCHWLSGSISRTLVWDNPRFCGKSH